MKTKIVFLMASILSASACTQATGPSGGSVPSGTGGSTSSKGGSGGSNATGGSSGSGTGGAPGGTGGAGSAGSGSGGTLGSGGAGGDSSAGSGGSTTPPDAGSDGTESLPPPEMGEVGPPGFPGWKFSRAIKMDTTPTGAGITSTVANYPVAVILKEGNFDFSQAHVQGIDIRFGKSDGTPLPYAIERYDSAAKAAVFWVKVPEVKGNDNTQSFNMYWGNPAAKHAGDTTKVFTAADGFLGVYHLDEDGNNNPGGYKDSSDDPVNGTGVAMEPGSSVDARIGKGTLLQNSRTTFKGQWIKVDDPKALTGFSATDHPITASIWVYANSYPGHSRIGNYETPFCKGDRSWTIQRDYQGRWESCTKAPSDSCAIGPAAVAKAWVHLAITQTKSRLTFFLNGKQVASSGSTGMMSPHALGIGQQSQYNEKRQWDGLVDEARVLSVEKTADWIKLDYESQKEGSSFLAFGPAMMK
jgi:Concanavalin A-like lectin/glucanases superfamily/Domain of unknown function (DUF2341)